jgi:tungstate transport system permease protein
VDLLTPTQEAFSLLFSGNKDLWSIVWLSIWTALVAILLALPLAVMLGYLLAQTRFPGRRVLVVLAQALLSFPTVVVGLLIYLLLSRRGPFGSWELLFTPEAIILGYIVISFPIMVVFTLSAVQGGDERIFETARSLGASPLQASLTTLWEVRFGVMAAIVNSFGRVISEVGCALMVGGNIAGYTRNIPTAIALETSKGEFAQGIALGLVLMAIALAVNVVLAILQGEGGMK